MHRTAIPPAAPAVALRDGADRCCAYGSPTDRCRRGPHTFPTLPLSVRMEERVHGLLPTITLHEDDSKEDHMRPKVVRIRFLAALVVALAAALVAVAVP